jgi:hypothetical protein
VLLATRCKELESLQISRQFGRIKRVTKVVDRESGDAVCSNVPGG